MADNLVTGQGYLALAAVVSLLAFLGGAMTTAWMVNWGLRRNLQSAVITKISHAEIRSTHVTGLVTDLGIELGKLFYINRLNRDTLVRANRQKLSLLAKLIGSFFIGGLLGATSFKEIGFITTVFLAILLLLLVWHPVLNDAKNWLGPHRP